MIHTVPVAAIVLAGGQSRRMGRDKRSLADADGARTLMERAAEQVAWAQERYLSAGMDALTLEGFTTVADCVPRCGPLGGLVSCLRRTALPWAVALPCDMPQLTAQALLALYERRADDVDCVLFSLEGQAKALPALLRVSTALPALEAGLAAGELALFRLLRAKLRVLTLSAESLDGYVPPLLDNVNTPEDYARFLAAQGHTAIPEGE